jgi:sigma-B regulation protein RsbU (phosphoserine phosphatase)
MLALNHHHHAPLGWKTDTHYESARLTMQAEECLFFYTDGVVETMNDTGELFSETRLTEFLKRHQHAAAAEMAEAVLAETKKFAGTEPPHDDMTVLVVKYHVT